MPLGRRFVVVSGRADCREVGWFSDVSFMLKALSLQINSFHSWFKVRSISFVDKHFNVAKNDDTAAVACA